jgi:alkanesulfonate monooxygenase SsuD/methylene tetrahydromethanopterin reductase-like flavin-dependent oxidoreductase (luciferase family)
MALQVDFGLVTAQRAAGDDRSWQAIYDEVLELAVVAEDAGFDAYWLTEHHFTEDGYLSSVFPVLAAIAARTTRIAIGPNVALAPLYQALRLAEDAAAVQLLSHGRLLLGLAIGYRDEEFDALRVPKRERVDRLVEIVEVCRKAWTGEPFAHAGPTVAVDGLVVRPVPEPPPPIWLGGWVDPAIRRAAVHGDGYISPSGTLEDTEARVAVLDEAAAEAGRGDPLPIATATWVCVSPDGRAPEAVRRGVAHLYEHYERWYGSSSDQGGGRAVAEVVGQVRGLEGPAGLPPGVVAGTPAQVLDVLGPFASAFSRQRDHRMCVRLQYPGMSTDEVRRHVEVFATDVLPHLPR